jgi:ABC-2 type transport system permease protein
VIGLVRVELTRFRSRRAILVIAAVAVLLSAVVAFKTADDSRPFSAQERATAAAQADIAANDNDNQATLASCRADPSLYFGRTAGAASCERLLPTSNDFLDRSPLRLHVVMSHNGLSVALLLIVLLAIGGAAFAGADWMSGSITNQVLFEPRRSRVWAAKAVAVGLGSLTIAIVAMAVFWIPLRLVVAARDLPVVDGSSVVWSIVRVLVLAVLAPVFAYALSMLFRQTVATIGLLLGAGLAAEIVLGLLPLSGTGWLSPTHNVLAWILGRTRYLDPSLTCGGVDCDQLRTLDMWPAAGLMGLVSVVVLLGSWQVFRRRDLP